MSVRLNQEPRNTSNEKILISVNMILVDGYFKNNTKLFFKKNKIFSTILVL